MLLALLLAAQLPQVAIEGRLAADLRLQVGDTVVVATAAESPGTRGIVGAVYRPAPDPA